MKKIIFYCAILIMGQMYSQVGIGTTTPSSASMLEVSSTSDAGATYKGFMPPRVPDLGARDAITTSAADTGLLVFVENLGCLQIWNGSGWESVHCINDIGFVDLFQNFDLNTTWGYTLDVPFFDSGSSGFYGITNNSRAGFGVITTMTNKFLGVNDLYDEGNNGTPNFATITFDTIDLTSSSNGVTVSFDYEFYQFDGYDSAYYNLAIDGIIQPDVLLIQGVNAGGGIGASANGNISVNIPPGTISVSLKIKIRQDGVDDFAGIDNFAIVAN